MLQATQSLMIKQYLQINVTTSPKSRGQRTFKNLHSSVNCDAIINKLMLHGKCIVMYTYRLMSESAIEN